MTQHAKPPSPTLPATLIEAEAIDTISGWIGIVEHRMGSEEGRRVLRASIAEKLREGAISRMHVIAAAKAGDQDAESVLREFIVELNSRKLDMPTELAEYNMWIMAGASVKYPPGRKLGNTWKRDVAIALLVKLTMDRWPVPKTRSHHSKNNPERGLSACYLVARALGRRFPLDERGVERVIASRIEDKLAARLSAFLSPQ
jgi:hypothetical protein